MCYAAWHLTYNQRLKFLHCRIRHVYRPSPVSLPCLKIQLPTTNPMSSTSTPIPPHRFAEAIKELPLANLYSKAAEIRNSISHLQSSNEQLQSLADEGDRDCAEAIQENVVVIQRMEGRIRLLKAEVEGRGSKWEEDEELNGNGDVEMNGHGEAEKEYEATTSSEQRRRQAGGSIGDEELARRLREQTEEDEDGDGDGVHL